MSTITWITPEGFLFTATESVFTATSIQAVSSVTNSVSYNLIGGLLPDGLTISNNGIISGTPNNVLAKTTSTFIIRAETVDSFLDRNFYIDVEGADLPVWNTITITTGSSVSLTTSTTEGYLQLGVNNSHIVFENQWIDYQLSASPVESPENTKISYYILPGDGILPNGLTLDTNGKISGFVNILPNTISSSTCFSNVITDLEMFITENNPNAFQYITKDIKIYGFYVTAFDGGAASKRFFKILVINPNIFKASSTILPISIDILGLNYIPASVSYLSTPQFIQDSNLGIIKTLNNVYFDVSAFNYNKSAGKITYSINTQSGTLTELPQNLNLISTVGFIDGSINYQKEYLKDYTFTVKATNISNDNQDVITVNNTFTFSVQDAINDVVSWTKTGFLGTLTTNEISELFVKAKSNLKIKYQLENGTLPEGLTLNSDGTISGSVLPNINVSTTQTNYNFDVSIIDNNKNKFITGNFSIVINQTTSTDFINVWGRPYLSLDKRKEFNNFINNTSVFEQDLLYRPLDKNFGVQKDLKMFIHYGVEKENLADYLNTLDQNFQKRRFTLGDILLSTAIVNKIYYYDLIYINVIDKFSSQTQELPMNFVYNGVTYYPTTLKNMRERFSNFHVTTEELNLKTLKVNNISQIDKFFSFIPLCFVTPGNGSRILNNIKQTKFKFNTFDFTLDRIIFQSSKDFAGNKYLLIKQL